MNAYVVLSLKGKQLGSITCKGYSRDKALSRALLVFGPCRIKEVSRLILTVGDKAVKYKTLAEAKQRLDKAKQGRIKPEYIEPVCDVPDCVGCPPSSLDQTA